MQPLLDELLHARVRTVPRGDEPPGVRGRGRGGVRVGLGVRVRLRARVRIRVRGRARVRVRVWPGTRLASSIETARFCTS